MTTDHSFYDKLQKLASYLRSLLLRPRARLQSIVPDNLTSLTPFIIATLAMKDQFRLNLLGPIYCKVRQNSISYY